MEEWKQVPFAPKYEASTHGNVRNKKTGKTLRQFPNQDGYMKLSLRIKDCSRGLSAHRLVALTFIPNPENKPTVNHKNHVRNDNHMENLEWSTMKEQNNHSRQHVTRNGRSVWKCDPITGVKIEKFESLHIAADSVNKSGNGYRNISASANKNYVKNSLVHQAYGFFWKYDDIVIEGEIWAPLDPEYVKGAKDYEISSEGRMKHPSGRIYFPHGSKGKYPLFSIGSFGFKSHRLVALTFLEIPHGKSIVNHIDGNKKNCRMSNLEWVTSSENTLHAMETGLRRDRKTIKQYDMKGNFIKEFPSVKLASVSVGARINPKFAYSQFYQWRKLDDSRPVLDLSHKTKRQRRS